MLPIARGLFLFVLLGMLPDSARAAELLTGEELLKKAEASAKRGNRAEAIAMCTQAILSEPRNLDAYALRGRFYSEERQDTKAIADFDEVIKKDPSAAGIFQMRGWLKFRLGKFEESIADFDRVVALVRNEEPRQWQRGIVYYYAKRFGDGRKQFELHQTVNPSDVENAVWHYLCVARLESVEKARATLIPIAADSRIPMMKVHELFAGKAKPEDVLKEAESGPPNLERRNRQLFYAHLYLGLYYDAAGDLLKTREHIYKAATDFTSDQYMGDVARVHAKLLKEQQK
jgi:lipoprotein NlpI